MHVYPVFKKRKDDTQILYIFGSKAGAQKFVRQFMEQNTEGSNFSLKDGRYGYSGVGSIYDRGTRMEVWVEEHEIRRNSY